MSRYADIRYQIPHIRYQALEKRRVHLQNSFSKKIKKKVKRIRQIEDMVLWTFPDTEFFVMCHFRTSFLHCMLVSFCYFFASRCDLQTTTVSPTTAFATLHLCTSARCSTSASRHPPCFMKRATMPLQCRKGSTHGLRWIIMGTFFVF